MDEFIEMAPEKVARFFQENKVKDRCLVLYLDNRRGGKRVIRPLVQGVCTEGDKPERVWQVYLDCGTITFLDRPPRAMFDESEEQVVGVAMA
ncbi:MAG: hypothetical protein NTY61_03205 [Candidatus Parcubacteria bacterium]|nr:hypothetical protein [Candidatus Parcubacteria bacterium]